ncbi:MAG: T9SS type A sorting domain-containing protein [candidate division Zixibacteria bacterium]|nr:T9SS type A sorting domain-containing protein [candidate division Zixibacteria bacterium]
MTVRYLLIALLIAVIPTGMILADSFNEYYFKFELADRAELDRISHVISIDDVRDGTVYAYANDRELAEFKKLGYSCEILPHPGKLIQPRMTDSVDEILEWDSYPTYDAYVSMMYQFEADYPALCSVENIGNSVEGREIIVAKISDNVAIEEPEPEVFYTATMHGDETAGYILMLRLIDSLLTAYGSDARITDMVNNMEIYINPLANPDGTYAGGNNTVYGATRYNANGYDLNRNFPDPEDGPYPGGPRQIETTHMMNLAEAHSFVISANFHGGAEVVNYPWDTWQRRHPDNDWYIDVCRAYADTVHNHAPSGYMDGFDNGITNGWDWYTTSGNRQDYMNYFHGCREVTIELSDTKLLPESQLNAHWEYNRLSLLQWLENSYYGIQGFVSDGSNGDPVDGFVKIVGHDMDSTEVRTDSDDGGYYRMIEAGTYDVQFIASGYVSQTVNDVTIIDGGVTPLDVQLDPLTSDPVIDFVEHNAGASNPGDVVSMNITLVNNGGGNAYDVNGVLSTSDAYINITQNTSSYPTIPAIGGTGTSDDQYLFEISSSCPMFHVVDFELYVTAQGGYSTTLNFQFLVGSKVVIYADDFSTDLGWSGLGGSGEWTIGEAAGGYGGDNYGGPDPSQDHSPTSDNRILGNDLQGGSGGDYNANLNTTYWVESPSIDCSNYNEVEMKFYRWLGVERDAYDNAYMQVYDGATWHTLFENGNSTIDESAWSLQEYDVSAYADGNANFRIRFGIGTTDGSWQYCGWNIDDIELKGYGEAQPQPDVAIDMVPNNPPVSVPRGGAFYFTGILHNTTQQSQQTDVWIMLQLPGGAQFGPLLQFNNVNLSPGQTITANNVRQDVPGYAPLGTYDYISYNGDYPSSKMDSASFEFTVVNPLGGDANEWTLSGWFGGENIPLSTRLHANYPNPFNASTNISFDLARDGNVKLEVFNVMGQKLETVVNSRMSAGSHSMAWDASRYSSGVYFYRFTADGIEDVKRMVLLK